MRTMIQRLGAMAMAIALVLGMTGIASAQTSDSETITVTASVGGYIEVNVNNPIVNLGTLDSFGFGTYSSAAACFNASTPQGAAGAIYSSVSPTIVTVKSTRSYNLTLSTNDPSGLFLVFNGDQGCGSPYFTFAFAATQSFLNLPATGPAGFQQTFSFGAQIPLNYPDSSLSSTFTGLYTANAV